MQRYIHAITKIVSAQRVVMGPIATQLAMQVTGLVIVNEMNITINGDPKKILEALVLKYKEMFGEASLFVSKEAIDPMRDSFSSEELPQVLLS